tara:strand:+ start:3681 stop:3872 length:192 start_codon:yes stop_codon:yes gene_type:complete
VTQAIYGVKGVRDVKVVYNTKTAHVIAIEKLCTPQGIFNIQKALKKKGYGANPIKGKGQPTKL